MDVLSLNGFNRLSRATMPAWLATVWTEEGMRARAGLAVRGYRYLSDATRHLLVRTHRRLHPLPMRSILSDVDWREEILGPGPKVAEGCGPACPGCGADLPGAGVFSGAGLAMSCRLSVYSLTQFAAYTRDMVDELALSQGTSAALDEVRHAGGWREDLLGPAPKTVPHCDEIEARWQEDDNGLADLRMYLPRGEKWEDNLRAVWKRRGPGIIELHGITGYLEATPEDPGVKWVPTAGADKVPVGQ